MLTPSSPRIAGKCVHQGGAERSRWGVGHYAPQDTLIPNLCQRVWLWEKGTHFGVRWIWVYSLAFPLPDYVILGKSIHLSLSPLQQNGDDDDG